MYYEFRVQFFIPVAPPSLVQALALGESVLPTAFWVKIGEIVLRNWCKALGPAYHIMIQSLFLAMTTAFCVKEKKNRELTSPRTVTFKNGRKAIQGKCSHCGTTLFRITGK